ncbi:hypothetical protein LQL77_24275 [Rhodococcus cerastii]|nr:hypothetical protein [Rhodococcus cerastii]
MDSNETDPLARDTGIDRHRFRSAKDWAKEHEHKRKQLKEHNEFREIQGLEPLTYAEFYYEGKE